MSRESELNEMRDRWESLDYDTRLFCTEYIFKTLVEHARSRGTYRYLIYDRLGFNMDAYCPLMDGLMISNEFELTSSCFEDESNMELKKEFHRYADSLPVTKDGNVNDERFKVYAFYWSYLDANRALSKREVKYNQLMKEIKERDDIIEKLTKQV